MKSIAQRVGSFLSGGDDGRATRDLSEQSGKVGRGDDFQKLVRRIILKTADGGSRVVQGDAFVEQELHNHFFLETFGPFIYKPIPVAMENVSHDAPHVVDEVRVVEIHAPAFFLGRETAQHQQACVGRKERLQGMLFGWNGGGGICWCHVYLSVCFTFMKIQSDI